MGLNASGLAVVVMTAPLLERFGYWDHWPSWALYAPHSSRVELYVARPLLAKLPEELQELVAGELLAQKRVDLKQADESTALWIRVPLAQWSLHALQTPVYPQSRFELGVARDLAQRVDSRFGIQVILLGTADRFSGQRSSWEFTGTLEIDQAALRFFWNTRPRFRMGR